MADVNVTIYKSRVVREGARPTNPDYPQDEEPIVVNPPGSPIANQLPPVEQRYTSEANMIADQANQRSGYLYYDGTNTWWYLGTTTGTIADYKSFGDSGDDPNKVSYNVADGKNATEKAQARLNIGSTGSAPQVITTAGSINDLAVTSNHLVFTGASVVLSGIVAGLDGEEITLLNASGTDLSILSQSTLSSSSNRFNASVTIPNLSILRIKYRTTTNRWFLENVGINDGRYVRKDIDDSKKGYLSFLNISDQTLIKITPNGTEFANVFEILQTDGTITFNINRQGQFRQNSVAGGSSSAPVILSHFASEYFRFRNNNPDSGETSLISARFINRAVFERSLISLQRSLNSNGNVRRDELYINYSQTVATTGTINNLALNADCKLLILSGADDLTGAVAVDTSRLLRIEARGANRIIRNESASSTAANRFSIGSDLTINSGEVSEFIYTNGRWRLLNNSSISNGNGSYKLFQSDLVTVNGISDSFFSGSYDIGSTDFSPSELIEGSIYELNYGIENGSGFDQTTSIGAEIKLGSIVLATVSVYMAVDQVTEGKIFLKFIRDVSDPSGYLRAKVFGLSSTNLYYPVETNTPFDASISNTFDIVATSINNGGGRVSFLSIKSVK